ncbi:MAG: hypothetical protein U0414_26480 [Polyangiaceae bacterium]
MIALSANACGSTVSLESKDGKEQSEGSTSTSSGAPAACAEFGDCPSDVSNDPEVPQAEAQNELVGEWVVCDSSSSLIGEFGGSGISFSADGSFRLLAPTDNGCVSGFSDPGTWSLEDHSGIGLPDEYQLSLFWADDSVSPVFIVFANGRSFIRLENGGGGWDDLVRID